MHYIQIKKRHLHIIKNHLHIKNPKRNIIKHHFLVNKAAMEFHSAPPPYACISPDKRPVIRETPNTGPTPRKPFKCHRQIKTHGLFRN